MMRRILVLVTVALVMAAMMAFGAGAASAQPVVFLPGASCLNPASGKDFAGAIITPDGLPTCTGFGSPSGPPH
jgi:hypothetical protein